MFSRTISGACLARGTVNPNNPCQICDPARSNAGFSPNGGALCGVGPTECSAQDTCSNQGVCIPNHVAAGTRCGGFSNTCANPDQCNGSGVCQSRVAQRVEVCDNVDNDCDGANNEGIDLSTDPNNCGACSRSCLGGACVAGNCQPFPLVTGRVQPNDILVDANNVYWIDSAGVSRFPKNPNGTSVVQTIPSAAASSLQRDGAKLYWATPRTIVRGNTDGTALENFVPNRPGNIQGTFLSDGFVYWLENSTAGGLDYRRALLSNPVPETFGGESDETARLLGTQGDCIYYGRNATTDITRSCAVTGGFNLFFPHIVRGFHIDGAAISDVYVASQGRGIVRLPAVGVPERIVVASSAGLGDVKADGTHIYYVEGPSSSVTCTTNGALSRIRKAAGTAQLIAPAQSCFAKMVIDTDAIYWTNFQGGQIMKMAKPAP